MPTDRAHRADANASHKSGDGEPAPQPGPSSDLLIVAIGASAGGLEAFQKLLDGLAPDADMAFIIVQHLDPSHPSLLSDLLAGHTKMKVVQATQGARLARANIYVIPPGRYLAVEDGALRLSEPTAPHGARLPFDFLLQSLARTAVWASWR
jgi:two-component system CheB/CheR fusion protein